MDYRLGDACAICGAAYGEHRDADGACPDPECETQDHKGGWLASRYEPVDCGLARRDDE